MDCTHARPLLSAQLDGELRGLRRWRLARHLHACAACRAQLAALQALRAHLRAHLPRQAAPEQLRERVRALLENAPAGPAGQAAAAARPGGARAAAPRRWQWLAGGALAGSVATVCAIAVANFVAARLAADDLVAEAVRAHVQASLQERQIEVASSDRHTVKPWLSARLDYSPPVLDLADEGFPLVGGRLDTLHGRKVATLVYRYRLHTIDVFVRPQPAQAPAGPPAVRGFNVAHASGGGMDYLAVSDASADVLEVLVRRLAAAAPPGGEPPPN